MLAVTLERLVRGLPLNFRLRRPRYGGGLRGRPGATFFLGALLLRARFLKVMLLAVVALGNTWLGAQTSTQTSVQNSAGKVAGGKVASIKSFRIVQEKDGQAVEILSTRPVVPEIQAISDPDRVVIDLPNARLDVKQKRVSVQADQISAVRADQFQENPPVARVVVDLLGPRMYTWDAAGNRLVVHLGRAAVAAKSSPFEPAGTPSLTAGQKPVVAEVRAAGPLALAGKDAGSGSSITAGPDTAIVKLSSGGELRVCPGTTVSVTPSQNRHNLMLSMNTGAMEAHFALDASSDSVMTPDFRILLVGPGEFHYAFSADNQGNTCVRALPGNTASAIVSELLGDRTYQVKATDQLMFRLGQLDRVDAVVPLECGCPPARDATVRTANSLGMQSAVGKTQEAADSAPTAGAGNTGSAAGTLPATLPGSLEKTPASAANEVHVEVEAPLVFHATGPPPAPVEDVRALPLDSRQVAMAQVAALPPPVAGTTEKAAGAAATGNQKPRGFFRRIGGFFASWFH